MNHSEKDDLEKKILEKLKKEVFEKDKELQNNQDDLSIRDATKEALAEMTSLSKKDVDALYEKIKKEELEILEQKRISRDSTKKILYTGIGIVGVILSLVFFFRPESKPEAVLFFYSEDFEGETSDFINQESYAYKTSIKDGAYVHDNNATNSCYFNSSPPINFPKNYTVTAKSTWKNGSYATYGLNLINNNTNYVHFALTKEGKTNVSVRLNGKYASNDWNNKIFTDNSNEHVQRIDVKGGKYQYYLDDKFIREGVLPFDFKYAGFRTCDHQTINYDEISIKNNETGEYLLKENFDNPSPQVLLDWNTSEDITYSFEKKEGKFVMSDSDEKHCHRAEAFLPSLRKDKKWELSVDATWKEGQQKDFGIMFITTSGEAGEFSLSSTGKVIHRMINKDFKITYNTAYSATEFISKGQETHRLTIQFLEDNKINFLVNGKKVLSDTKNTRPQIEKIGLTVCGKQIVEFDNIKYEEIK